MEIEGAKRIEEEPQRPVKIIVAGAGDVSRHYLDHFKDNPNAQVVGITDEIPERAADRALEHGIDWVGTFAELLKYGNADLFVNLTPPHIHSKLNIAAMEAGLHVFSEKPMATSLQDAYVQMKVSEREDKRLGIAPETFLTPTFQLARQIIDGEHEVNIGEPEFVKVSFTANGPEDWHPNPERFYGEFGGPMSDMSPYYTHVLINLFGPVAAISAVGKTEATRTIKSEGREGEVFNVAKGVYTHIDVGAKFDSGPEAELTFSFDSAQNEPHILIYGQHGVLKLPDPNSYGLNPVEFSDDPEWVSEGNRSWIKIMPIDPGKKITRGFASVDFGLAAIRGHAHQLDAQLGFNALDFIASAYESAKYGVVVDLNTTATRPEPYDWQAA